MKVDINKKYFAGFEIFKIFFRKDEGNVKGINLLGHIRWPNNEAFGKWAKIAYNYEKAYRIYLKFKRSN